METTAIKQTIAQLAATLSDTERRELAKTLNPNAKRRLGTARQAAAILETCPTTVKRYARRGLLEGIKIGARRLRFDLDEVQRLHDFGA